jgi:hypothetical protein
MHSSFDFTIFEVAYEFYEFGDEHANIEQVVPFSMFLTGTKSASFEDAATLHQIDTLTWQVSMFCVAEHYDLLC